jgi:glycogen operon protein
VALRESQPVLRRRTFLNGRKPGEADVLWLRPEGGEMQDADWHDPSRRTLGILLDGDNIRERDARGEPVRGDTLLILLNAAPVPVDFVLPYPNRRWECLLTSTPEPPPAALEGSGRMDAHSSAVLRLA